MSCCGGNMAAECAVGEGSLLREEELLRSGKKLDNGRVQYVFSVPNVSCGKCISTVEKALSAVDDVQDQRVNLTLRRVSFTLPEAVSPVDALDEMQRIGYPATPFDFSDEADQEIRRENSRMLRALAVAGFAAGNIMLLSVSVWSGADGPTRDLFHLLSAMIAIPTVAYSGQIFFRNAWAAVRGGHLNMDVPISLAIILATGMSVYESLNSGTEAYFDAAVTLLFFLLIGRYLDFRMRDRARNAVLSLSKMAARGATLVENGATRYIPADEIEPGMTLRIAAGERMPVDAVVSSGSSDLDRSLVTGESAPVHVGKGSFIEAGTLNLTGPLDVRAEQDASHSFLANVMEMLAAAEKGRGSYVRLADRMAQLYAPAVHIMAALAFVGWMIFTGGDWHTSLYTAIAVLIITCPCALGLAVPVVHVIGAARLFEAGILMKDGSALERLAEADTAVFDKTGTLTTGTPEVSSSSIDSSMPEASIAVALANRSIHPASRAIAQWFKGVAEAEIDHIVEVPGSGVEARWNGKTVRLGRAAWVAEIAEGDSGKVKGDAGVAFAIEKRPCAGFTIAETLREDAASAVAMLSREGLSPQLLSGDAEKPVRTIAEKLKFAAFRFGETPKGKIEQIEAIQKEGHRVLMIGDGLNDAPALAAGHVSMAPSSASDAGRMAADFVFTRDSLLAVPFAREIAKRAGQLVRQNFAIAILYNCIAVPLAMAGIVTPLFAAIAMSASSIVVVANSSRLMAGSKWLETAREGNGVQAGRAHSAALASQS